MSERWGHCGFCKGTGERREAIPGSATETGITLTDEELAALKKIGVVHFRKAVQQTLKSVLRTCGMCDGTGHTGDAMDPSAPH